MGSWLKINGDAIYGSQPWIYQNDTKTPDVWYTSQLKADSNEITVYAIILNYPYDSAGVNLYALGGRYSDNTKARMLGYPDELKVCMQTTGFPPSYADEQQQFNFVQNIHFHLISFECVYFSCSGMDLLNRYMWNFPTKQK